MKRFPQPLNIILAISAAVYLLCANATVVGQYEDDAIYILSATSLIRDGNYNVQPAADVKYRIGQPPGLPIILAPVTLIFGKKYVLYKILPLLFMLAGIAVCYRYFIAAGTGTVTAGWLALLLALHPLIVQYATVVMTESIYLFLSITVLLMLQKKSPWWVTALLAGACFYMRTIGIALILAVILEKVITRDYKYAVKFAGVTLLMVLGYFVWRMWYDGKTLTTFITAAGIWFSPNLLDKVWYYGRGFFTRGIFAVVKFDHWAIVILGWILIIIGLARASKNSSGTALAAGLYFVSYTLILLAWRNVAARFLLPLLPLVLLYTKDVVLWIIRKVKLDTRAVKYAAAGFLLVLYMFGNVKSGIASIRNEGKKKNYPVEAVEWVNKNTLPAERFLGNLTFYFYTNRETILFPNEDFRYADDFYIYVCNNRIDYIFLFTPSRIAESYDEDNDTRTYMTNVDEIFVKQFRRYELVSIDEEQRFKLFRVLKGKREDFTRSYAAYAQALGLYQQGKIDDAIAMTEQALEVTLFFPKAYALQGSLYAEKKMYAEAINWITRALEQEPEYPYAQAVLGGIYQQMKQDTQAIEVFKKAYVSARKYGDTALAGKLKTNLEELGCTSFE
ncbi:MAG: tetratricopeptide repeat protein [Elusimicrobiota bacterium]